MTTIIDTTRKLGTLHEAYNAAKAAWPNAVAKFEITSEVYDEALGVVPPIYGFASAFWVGEIHDHTEHGPISLECWTENSDHQPYRNACTRYYCRMSVVRRPY